ncbi:hypothetical protein MKW94_019084 [Papaver nudicaule]|uniref:SWIM-type domain-containing protein n=1 Tax=Papaver nudicaule TaxID=74823 RepID=A0AA41VA18_PAPNU|nr:hypothetical protein [Papaver nudicaule]
MVTTDLELESGSERGSLTPMKRGFEATFSSSVEGQQKSDGSSDSDPSSRDGNSDEDEDDILPKNMFCGENLNEEESWGRWVTVYGFKSWEVDTVLCGMKSFGEILKHVQGLDNANWMHILYKKQCDAVKAMRKSWIKVSGNFMVGLKPLDPIERQTLNKEGRKKQYEEPARPVSGRMSRALHEGLRLLHRVEADFFILGSTGNVYIVRLSKTPSCNCPDGTIPCKHILFVLLRVLGIPRSDHCLTRKILRPYHMTRLLNMAASSATLAGVRARDRFQHLLSISEVGPPPPVIELGSGTTCPICSKKLANKDEEETVEGENGMDDDNSEEFTSEDELAGEKGTDNADEVHSDQDDTGSSEDEPDREYELVRCWACKSVGHKECLVIWRKRQRRSVPTCMNCKSEWWMDSSALDMYPDLAAYIDKD